jgi:integrase/recombinase XerD
LVALLARKVGITKRVHPHAFRHAAATHLLRRGVNPILVRDIMGHGSLAMIDQVYSHLAPQDAYQAALKAFQDEER